ncbi:ExeM/NucH family extracellular endonuclease [Pseudoxanthomonas sacheonensis]|uniref:ExeM/NucH family extracellular endonuclease n=1 Tax=Pseudoxanthomonas sacheonensis TaxID=443615 RepID=UPI0013D6C30E|nr:ExeM/NucH family extracellular endonuclease [Pseudoxanthomonas sacheonensis]KAF1710118.1 endonuclease [Pseudoxanthomonas sacheonensis]
MTVTRFHASLLLALVCACGAASTYAAVKRSVITIGRAQGRGDRSPLEGQPVIVQGTITGNFVDGMGGFFLQDGGDGDPFTSDGLFVLPPKASKTKLRAGDTVRVTGRVFEDAGDGKSFGTLTTVRAERIEPVKLPKAVPVIPTVLTAPPDRWEVLEGMLVMIDAPLSLNGTDTRYAETTASFDERLWTPTEIAAPGSVRFHEIERSNARQRIVLDDASSRRDPKTVWYLPEGVPRSGSTASGARGIVDQRQGSYRLQLTAPLEAKPAARPAAPKAAGNLRVAAFNMENLFNGDGSGGGFPTLRGATAPAQLKAQTDKLVLTLKALNPDIAALMELENDGYGPQSSLAQFVDALNEGGGDWRFIDAQKGPGSDEIRVGLIYRKSRVSPVGKPAVLEEGPFGARSRVPLAQAFRRSKGSQVFLVVANHFKSKGCTEAAGPDADQRDGQACWNALRLDSAQRLDAWLKTNPTGQRTDKKLVVGDFNAYAMEDPMRLLRERGWKDAFAVAKVQQPYSYLYGGMLGRLDHALLSPALAKRLRGAAEWHSNADEPESEGYAGSDIEGPWRSSDHDPMVLGFDL